MSQSTNYYSSDFESDDAGLVGSGSWQWGLVRSGPDTAYSGFLCWATNLAGPYPESALDFLETPEIDLTEASSAELTFWHWYEFESDGRLYYDGGNVKISADGGEFELLTPFRGYSGFIEDAGTQLDQEPVFSSLEVGRVWQPVRINLQSYVGKTVVIRFEMASDASVNYPGWYIDDIAVTENLSNDVGIWSIESPEKMLDVKLSPFVPALTVYNAGSARQSFETEVTVTVNGISEYVSRRVTADLSPDTAAEVTFDPWTPTTSSGTFHLSARTILAGDGDSSNDSLSTSGELFEKSFSNVTALAGLDVHKNSGHGDKFSWGDYDRDGWVDLYMDKIGILRNSGNGTFGKAFMFDEPFLPIGGKWGDYDNDGHLDLFIADIGENWSQPGQLYRYSDDLSSFENVSDSVGFLSREPYKYVQSCLWFDYDNDGYLDLYVMLADLPDIPNRLYHNTGAGRFEEIAGEANLDIEWAYAGGTSVDYDNDGYADLLLWRVNVLRLFRNQGDGTFGEVTSEAGIEMLRVEGAAFGDYDNDGNLDFYVIGGGAEQNKLYHNNGDGTFTDRALQAGVNIDPEGFDLGSPAWGDYNNDGYLDLLMKDRSGLQTLQLYRNNGDGSFSWVDAFPGVDRNGRSSVAWADYDNDGDLDLFVSGGPRDAPEAGILYRNNSDQINWLTVKLYGNQSNSDGYGARVLAKTGALQQIREINGGAGFNQEALLAHFGCAKANLVDTLEIRWPSGVVDQLTNVEVNQIIEVEEGKGLITGIEGFHSDSSVPENYFLAQNYPNPFNPTTTISFRLTSPTPVHLVIFNVLGQEVITLVDEELSAGKFVKIWNGENSMGHAMPSGVYVYRLEAGDFVTSKKMVLLR